MFAYESDADHREKERDKTPREERDERAWRNFGLERCAHAEAGADGQDSAEYLDGAEVGAAQAHVNDVPDQVEPGQGGSAFRE